MGDFLTFILIMLGVLTFIRFLSALSVTSQNQHGKPVNPNMTAPCPPHDWADPPQKGLGIVYQCTKCKQTYPSSVEQRP